MEVVLDSEYKDGSRMKVTRFTCECLSPHCSLDVTEEWYSKDAPRMLTFSWWSQDYSWGQKLRWCWEMLREGRGFETDFILRKEDIPELIKLLKD